jgi:hypothetical protein
MAADAATRTRSWMVTLARGGYAARGIVYLIIGGFAVFSAFGRSETRGSEGALASILAQPFGAALLWIVGLGLVAFAGWRVVQALRDTDNHGSGAKGWAIRAGLVGAAVSYGALALLAIGMASGNRDGGGDPSAAWLATAHDWGVGWIIAYAVPAVVAAVGVAHLVKGARGRFTKYFRCGESVMRWVRPLGRFGLIARGVVFMIIAALLLFGSRRYDAAHRPGLDDALNAVEAYPFGWFVLLVIAFGLIAFGCYSLAQARYRHVSPD